ncbi:MAG: DJ-1/PfpI family protein [Reichenbachiella sp.]|uniref:DJ-1/PfpI family protein n=1 Tax=Reichenbachiella sp. TaxID=2184521 RepID=UPI00326507A2
MKKYMFGLLIICALISCENQKVQLEEPQEAQVYLNPELPTIGIIIFEGVITNEILAPLDVFSKHTAEGEKLFNVVFLSGEQKTYKTEEGLRILPDFTFEETPKLNVLIVASSYEPEKQYTDKKLISFIQSQYDGLDYVASHCAGAFTLGATGLIDDKKVVTYITGGDLLQKEFPQLKVQDDTKVSVAKDGNYFSSNGSLVTYTASLDLLQELTDQGHRKYVEGSLYLDRLSVSN